MDITTVLSEIDQEITKLSEVREALSRLNGESKTPTKQRKVLHWTQRPENKNRLKRHMNKMRRIRLAA